MYVYVRVCLASRTAVIASIHLHAVLVLPDSVANFCLLFVVVLCGAEGSVAAAAPMATNGHYSHCMQLLSFHKPSDRYACAEVLLDQRCSPRSSVPLQCNSRRSSSSAWGSGAGRVRWTPTISAPVVSRMDSSPRVQHAAGSGLGEWRGEDHARRQQNASLLGSQAWRAAGRARGGSNYFSLPLWDDSRSSMMHLDSQREEKRRLRLLRQGLGAGKQL